MIFFNKDPAPPANTYGVNKITALRVNEGTGLLEFYDLNQAKTDFINKQSSYYIGNPTLLGAIFTDDINIYNCVMKNAFSKLNIVSKIYLGKIGALSGCTYDSAPVFNIISKSSEFGPSINLKKDIENEIKKLEGQNSQLQRKSCPLIY